MSFNQGLSARTVLTNRSKFITIILDEKNEKETLSKRFTNVKCYRKGSRLMHNTTLTLEKQPVFINNVSTTTTESYSGKKNLFPAKRPEKCRSQHRSQIIFGESEPCKLHMEQQHVTKLVLPVFEDKGRWRLQMSGQDMCRSMDYGLPQITLEKEPQLNKRISCNSYLNNQHALGPPTEKEYNVISGETLEVRRRDNFHRISGNKLLHKFRTNCQEQLIH